MLFDTHAHLDDPVFDGDREEVISSLASYGVGLVLNPGADPEGCVKAVELAEKYSFIYAAVGIHPEYAERLPENYIEKLRALAKSSEKVKAIGEIGLDYHYKPVNKEAQIALFESQMELAKELRLPVIIHTRDAYADTLGVLKKYPTLPKVVHCFSGNLENAKELVAMGCHISFTGVITFKNAVKFEEILRFMPRDRLFFETDSPYLSPEPVRGTRNDPRNVRYIVEKAAQTIGADSETLAAVSTENAKRFFGI